LPALLLIDVRLGCCVDVPVVHRGRIHLAGAFQPKHFLSTSNGVPWWFTAIAAEQAF
jgi:hypothetical protein